MLPRRFFKAAAQRTFCFGSKPVNIWSRRRGFRKMDVFIALDGGVRRGEFVNGCGQPIGVKIFPGFAHRSGRQALCRVVEGYLQKLENNCEDFFYENFAWDNETNFPR